MSTVTLTEQPGIKWVEQRVQEMRDTINRLQQIRAKAEHGTAVVTVTPYHGNVYPVCGLSMREIDDFLMFTKAYLDELNMLVESSHAR